jgi:hypothetical protein
LQHLGIAAAINVVRVGAWLDGDERAPTRVTAFQRLTMQLKGSFPTVYSENEFSSGVVRQLRMTFQKRARSNIANFSL